MIIGIDASRANLEKKTGTEWYAFHLIQEFKKIADPQDQLILYTREPLRDDFGELPPHVTNKVLSWPPRMLWTQIRLSWEMLFHAPNVLFVPAHTIPIIHRHRTVTTIHDVGFEHNAKLYSQNRIGTTPSFGKKLMGALVRLMTLGRYGGTELDYHRWSVRFALNHARHVITISQFSKNEIIHYFPNNRHHITVIYHAPGYAYRPIENRAELAQQLSALHINRPYFLFIGRLEEKKNVATLITAFSLYKKKYADQHQLVLVGSPGFGYKKIKAIIDRENIKSDIIELGWTPNETLPHLMNGATIFVFPSAYEGFGLPIIEAMQCGTPVITSNVGAMKEIGSHGAVLVDQNDPESITDAMHSLVHDAARRAQCIKQGQAFAKTLSWKKTAAQTLAVIKQ